jgi:hypothetical protein
MQARAWDTTFDPPAVRFSCVRPRRFVEWFLRLRETIGGIGSATGSQLELARLSVDGSLFIRDDTGLYGAIGRSEERRVKFAIGAKIWGALVQLEQAILERKHSPGPKRLIRCERRFADLVDGDGSTIVGPCRDPETGDLTGWVTVDMLVEAAPTNEDVAIALGVPERNVRSRTQSAYRKIDSHPLLRALGTDDAA